MSFQTHDKETAPEKSKPLLEAAEKAYGFLPNLLRTFAESPAALEAYLGISKSFDKASLSPTERQVLLLTVSAENGCEYCVAAHSTIAGMRKVPDEVIQALRTGTPLPDARLQALRAFTRSVIGKRGWVAKDVESFLRAGFTKANVLEVLTGVAMKTLSNYTNHIAETPLDEPFRPQAWSSQELLHSAT